mgnify:CR=1 FL=1
MTKNFFIFSILVTDIIDFSRINNSKKFFFCSWLKTGPLVFKKKVYEKIELKSTKDNAIPGSSVQQINPDEWVIFVKHTRFSIITGGGIISKT